MQGPTPCLASVCGDPRFSQIRCGRVCEAGPLLPMSREVLGSKLPQPQTKGKVPRLQKLGGAHVVRATDNAGTAACSLSQEASRGLGPLVLIGGTCAQQAIVLGIRAELTSPTSHLTSSRGDG